jgi:pilus assembly protein CpaE
MLTTLIFGVTQSLTEYVSHLCGESGDICVYKTLDSYRSPHEVARLLNTYCPELIFLQLAASEEEGVSAERVRLVVEQIRMVQPETALVGLLPKADEAGLRIAAELGIVEILIPPVAQEEFRAVVFRALDRSAGAVRGNVFTFLPAKSGSGATVTALNVAGCLAREFHRKVLLLEADIQSGPVAIMLNIQPEQSITDALDYSNQLSAETWRQMVAKVDDLDVLATSGARTVSKTSPFSYFRLLRFARDHYDDVIVDLPGVVEDAAEPLLSNSKGVYVVCTPEVTSLALARRRLRQLELRGIPDSVVHVILNRSDQNEPTLTEIEESLGRKIAAELPNDYRALRKAVESGGFVDPDTEFGKGCASFAAALLGDGHEAHPVGGSKWKALLGKLGVSVQNEGVHTHRV